jgi:acyl-CoA thioester hydrolase
MLAFNGSEPKADFAWPVRVYWEDTDAGGIVFYANYLKFMERARTEWLRSLGFDQSELRDATGGMFVVAETALKYHAPAKLDDLLTVTVNLQNLGKMSASLGQSVLFKSKHIEDKTKDRIIAQGNIRIGWVSALTHKPMRMPVHLVTKLHEYGIDGGAAFVQDRH